MDGPNARPIEREANVEASPHRRPFPASVRRITYEDFHGGRLLPGRVPGQTKLAGDWMTRGRCRCHDMCFEGVINDDASCIILGPCRRRLWDGPKPARQNGPRYQWFSRPERPLRLQSFTGRRKPGPITFTPLTPGPPSFATWRRDFMQKDATAGMDVALEIAEGPTVSWMSF